MRDLVLEVDELARQALFEILGGKHDLESRFKPSDSVSVTCMV